MRVVSVAFNIRADKLFEYTAEEKFGADLLGRRVLAPLGGRLQVGVVMAAGGGALPIAELRAIKTVFDDMPPLPPATRALIRFCADYYHCPQGIVAAAILPKFFRRASRCKLPAGCRLIGDGDGIAATRKKARAIVQLLAGGEVIALADIRRQIAHPETEIKRLSQEGIIAMETAWESASPPLSASDAVVLTPGQRQAADDICVQPGFRPYLLLGKTGSGKTEVYMQLLQKILTVGRQALVLTPEIHLTPQLENTFRRRFPRCRLAVLHSGLPDGERARRWLMATLGHADIVLGTRLAVLTPMPKLGLIVVDEEHDDSYKQEEGFIFSARNVAVWRARNEEIPVVAASATPSLESYYNAQTGRYCLCKLPQRVQKKPPCIQLLSDEGGKFHSMSRPFLRALDDALSIGGQALIFINRRGYSPLLQCNSCRRTAACTRCSARLTVHRRAHILMCHWCGGTRAITPCCECGGEWRALGAGTQRVEEALQKLYPATEIARLDGDSLARRDSFGQLQQAIESGEKRLLVGTQIVAKGHNFPRLSFIGILDADVGLLAPDFRAQERLFALLSQVVGRGTRNPDGCRVAIQTARAEHPFYSDLRRDDIESLWRRLLSERKRAGLPPFSHLALLRASHPSESEVRRFLSEAAAAAEKLRPQKVAVFDPVPALRAKIADRHRWQLLMQSPSRPALHKLLKELRTQLPAAPVRWNVDIDPLNA